MISQNSYIYIYINRLVDNFSVFTVFKFNDARMVEENIWNHFTFIKTIIIHIFLGNNG
jgi:hypothetical protein